MKTSGQGEIAPALGWDSKQLVHNTYIHTTVEGMSYCMLASACASINKDNECKDLHRQQQCMAVTIQLICRWDEPA